MAERDMSGPEMRQRLSWGAGIAIGMGLGVALGSALDNMGFGIVLGLVLGVVAFAGIGAFGRPRHRDERPEDEDPAPPQGES